MRMVAWNELALLILRPIGRSASDFISGSSLLRVARPGEAEPRERVEARRPSRRGDARVDGEPRGGPRRPSVVGGRGAPRWGPPRAWSPRPPPNPLRAPPATAGGALGAKSRRRAAPRLLPSERRQLHMGNPTPLAAHSPLGRSPMKNSRHPGRPSSPLDGHRRRRGGRGRDRRPGWAGRGGRRGAGAVRGDRDEPPRRPPRGREARAAARRRASALGRDQRSTHRGAAGEIAGASDRRGPRGRRCAT